MSEPLDVVIVGAGLSGVGAACHLALKLPHKRVAILEAREATGGTWDLFRYPGIRSDSDMFTLGYSFEPWVERTAIADGPSILTYINRTAKKYGVDSKIRFRHRVTAAHWSSQEGLWTVEADHDGKTVRVQTRFLWLCSGYYRYEAGHAPTFPGQDRFKGPIIHPQLWPEELDYAGKKVVVIGSGATAVTLVPSMALTAAHVTMLQRTPTYMFSRPAVDPFAQFFRRILPSKLAYGATRWKQVLLGMLMFNLSRRDPQGMKRWVMKRLRQKLGPDFDVRKHFNPPYDPWDQRLCLVPDDDLFVAIKENRASIVTDQIDTFTETGIKLRSGELPADIIVTATGLELVFAGGAQLHVDGKPVELRDTFVYKGCMFGGVPNLANTVGYTNASWTLKADLTAEYLCRVLRRMDDKRADVCVAYPDATVEPTPIFDLTSGYVLRAKDRLPKQGTKPPWRLYQNYILDIGLLRRSPVEDGYLRLQRHEDLARASKLTDTGAAATSVFDRLEKAS